MRQVFGACALIKWKRSCAVVRYNTKPSAQNSSCLSAKKMCCLRSRSFPTLPFRQNVCLGEHSGGWLLVCFLLQFLLVFCFPGWFCCFSVLFFFVCFGSVLLYIKRAELEKTSGQGDESFMSPNPCLGIQSPEIWPLDTARLYYNFIHISFLMKINLHRAQNHCFSRLYCYQ